jgi:hypothetical protein
MGKVGYGDTYLQSQLLGDIGRRITEVSLWQRERPYLKNN